MAKRVSWGARRRLGRQEERAARAVHNAGGCCRLSAGPYSSASSAAAAESAAAPAASPSSISTCARSRRSDPRPGSSNTSWSRWTRATNHRLVFAPSSACHRCQSRRRPGWSAGGNVLFGLGEADTITGGAGDLIDGEDGNDTILGRGGNDDLNGGEPDLLEGGNGEDTLSGGFDRVPDELVGGDGFDLFQVFSFAELVGTTDYNPFVDIWMII